MNKKKIFLIGIKFALLLLAAYFLKQDNSNIVEDQTSSSNTGSKQKIVNFSKKTDVLSKQDFDTHKKIVPKRNIANSPKKTSRSLSSKFKLAKKQRSNKISSLIKISKSTFDRDGVKFLSGLFAERNKRNVSPIKIYDGFYIYDSPSTNNNIGIAIKDNRIGFITGEIAFKTVDIESLKSKINKYSYQEIMSNKNIGVHIIRVDDFKGLNTILNDSELDNYNPSADIVFDFNVPK